MCPNMPRRFFFCIGLKVCHSILLLASRRCPECYVSSWFTPNCALVTCHFSCLGRIAGVTLRWCFIMDLFATRWDAKWGLGGQVATSSGRCFQFGCATWILNQRFQKDKAGDSETQPIAMLQQVRPVCSLNRSRGVAGEAGLAMTNLATYKFVHIGGKATQFQPLRGPSLSRAQWWDMTWYDPGSCIMAGHLLVAGWFVIYGAVCGWLVDWAWFHLGFGDWLDCWQAWFGFCFCVCWSAAAQALGGHCGNSGRWRHCNIEAGHVASWTWFTVIYRIITYYNLKCTQDKYIERAANQYVNKMHNIWMFLYITALYLQ